MTFCLFNIKNHSSLETGKLFRNCYWRWLVSYVSLLNVKRAEGSTRQRPNPHRTWGATRIGTQGNGTCVREWGCPHCMQATSKEKRSNLRARRVARAVWIGPTGFSRVYSPATQSRRRARTFIVWRPDWIEPRVNKWRWARGSALLYTPVICCCFRHRCGLLR